MINLSASQINAKDPEAKNYLTIGLAPAYGSLNPESVKLIDEALRATVAATTKLIGQMPPESRAWDNCDAVMMSNSLVEPASEGINKPHKVIRDDWYIFKVDGSPSRPRKMEEQPRRHQVLNTTALSGQLVPLQRLQCGINITVRTPNLSTTSIIIYVTTDLATWSASAPVQQTSSPLTVQASSLAFANITPIIATSNSRVVPLASPSVTNSPYEARSYHSAKDLYSRAL
jgi:hypothetical protein